MCAVYTRHAPNRYADTIGAGTPESVSAVIRPMFDLLDQRPPTRVPALLTPATNISVSMTIGGFSSNRVTIPVR